MNSPSSQAKWLRMTRWLLFPIAILLLLSFKEGKQALSYSFLQAVPSNEASRLDRPYEDWRQQELPFGLASFDLAPWRSYMDTWGSDKYLETAGIVFNVNEKEADATAQLLSETGIRSARIEINWSNIDFNDESKFTALEESRIRATLHALHKYGIRPLILLNANSGIPVPNKFVDVHLTKNAKAGSREIYVKSTAGIVVGYTGLSGQAYQTMYPIITSVDAKSGRLTLSAPLTKELKAGSLRLTRLKYRPFSGTVYSGGKANPAGQATMDGWTRYVKTVTMQVKKMLGTNGSADAGFDLEVWNEVTFGSQFLDINNYYEKKQAFQTYPSVMIDGQKKQGIQALLPLTLSFVRNPANGLPGVNVIDGFSNQHPWENGTEIYTGQSGFSRHYYTGYNGTASTVQLNDTTSARNYQSADGSIVAGSKAYFPKHVAAFPEYWYYAYQTEFVVRDLQPIPGPWSLHGRYTNNGDGQAAQVWMTESNWWRGKFAEELMSKKNIKANDARLRTLMQQVGAKASIRLMTFSSHKGLHTLNLFSAKSDDLHYSVIADAFYTALAKNRYVLNDQVRAAAGPQMKALEAVAGLMKGGSPIEVARPLRVEKVAEPEPRLVLKGDGTAAHPDQFNRDDLAILPYQLNENKFAIAYYVITRDLTHAWQTAYDPLDARRYDMKPETFYVTLSNILGDGAEVYSYDPITRSKIKAAVLDSSSNTITVELETVDYPRFLVIEEKNEISGPLITNTKLIKSASEAAFQFQTNVVGTATITWGPYPARTGGTFSGARYASDTDIVPLQSYKAPLLTPERLPPLTKGTWKWEGTISPAYSEAYTFILDTKHCNVQLKLDEQLLIDGCQKPQKQAAVSLVTGQTYQLELTLKNNGSGLPTMFLYWASDHQAKTPVPPGPDGTNRIELNALPGEPLTVPLPGFKSGDGVRLQFSASGSALTTRYPLWDYDVAGVWWPKSSAVPK
ncbi:PA14 domain-containing protein [Cohnella sp. GCM10020058]|uniref:PA14 domain-containing protein n=1 Tax=Cohnella sp. GCM10020058 TaxID=3317330 RepID=UPI003644236A